MIPLENVYKVQALYTGPPTNRAPLCTYGGVNVGFSARKE